jgi:hypothetical protein
VEGQESDDESSVVTWEERQLQTALASPVACTTTTGPGYKSNWKELVMEGDHSSLSQLPVSYIVFFIYCNC